MRTFGILTVVAAIAAASPAAAGVIDLTTAIAMDASAVEKMAKGEKVDPGPESSPVTVSLGKLVRTAMYLSFTDEASLPATAKASRFDIAMKAIGDGKVDYPIDDLKTIKDVLGKAYGPLIVGQVFRVLDGKTPVPAAGN